MKGKRHTTAKGSRALGLLLTDGAYREYAGVGVIEKSITGRISAEVVTSISCTPADDRLITNDLEFWVLVNNPVIDFLCRLFRPMVRGVLKSSVEFLVHTVQQLAVAVRASGGVDIPVPQGG